MNRIVDNGQYRKQTTTKKRKQKKETEKKREEKEGRKGMEKDR
jgi:hypothetical protein